MEIVHVSNEHTRIVSITWGLVNTKKGFSGGSDRPSHVCRAKLRSSHNIIMSVYFTISGLLS